MNNRLNGDSRERLNAMQLIQRANHASSIEHLTPRQLFLKFLILFRCQCCRSFYLTRSITLFDDGNMVCNCTKCGARRRISPDDAHAFNKFNIFLVVMLVVLWLSICIAMILN